MKVRLPNLKYFAKISILKALIFRYLIKPPLRVSYWLLLFLRKRFPWYRKLPMYLQEGIAILLVFSTLFSSIAGFITLTPWDPFDFLKFKWHNPGWQVLDKSQQPIHQVIAKGPEVDLNLKENSQGEFRWNVKLPSGTNFEFGLQNEGKVLPVVRVTSKDGQFVQYNPAGLKEDQFVTPSVKDNLVEWPLREGITARYTMQGDRVKADYIVQNKEAISNYKLDFDVDYGPKEFTPEIMPNGDIAWINGTQEIFTFPKPVVIDNAQKQFAGKYALKQSNNSAILTIDLPKDQINTSQFPITVDPVVIDNANVDTDSTAYGNGRKLLKDSYGNLIAFVDASGTTSNNDDIYYKNASSTSWTDAAVDLTGNNGGISNVAADIDSSNNLHATFLLDSSNFILYDKINLTYSGNDISSMSLGAGSPRNIDGTGKDVLRTTLTIANKGAGSGKEKVVTGWALNTTAGGVTRGEIRVVQCDVADDCTAVANWKNASEEINGTGGLAACSDVVTSGAAGLSAGDSCKGTADALFQYTVAHTTHHAVITQVPGRPKRTPGAVKKDLNGTVTDLSSAIDGNTGTADTINSLTTTDYIKVGDVNTFSKVAFDITNTNSNAATFSTLQYCSVNADTTTTCDTWTSLSNSVDNTATATIAFSEDGSLLFDEPSDWVTSRETGDTTSKYYIRMRPSAAFDASVSIAEVYIRARNAQALLAVVGVDATDDLSASYIPWDDVGEAGWENRPDNAGSGWRSDAGGASSALHNTGGNWGTATNFPLTATTDYINNNTYVAFHDCSGAACATTSALTIKYAPNNKDLTTTGAWSDTSFPSVTEGTDMVLNLTSDGADIYLIYVLDPGTNSLVYRKCTPSGGGTTTICDNASDWGSEVTLDNGTDNTHPQAIVSKTLGDTSAIDLVYTTTTTPQVEYERHYVNLADNTTVVAASADDASHRDCDSGTDDQDITATTVKLGREATDASCAASAHSENHAGFRFPSVSVSQGANISSAFLDFRVSSRTGTGAIDFTVYGEDADNNGAGTGQFSALTDCAVPCSGAISNSSSRTRTTSSSTQSIDFQTNTYRIDVTKMVQEVVCRGAANSQPCIGDYNGSGTWASGNAVVLLLISAEGGTSDNYISIVSQDDAGTTMLDPTLQINCVGSCSSSPTVTKRYSAGELSGVPSNTPNGRSGDLDKSFSSSDYTAVATDDTTYFNIVATNNHFPGSAYPLAYFKVNNNRNLTNDEIGAQAIVRSTNAASNKAVYLQVYRGGSTNAWETKATNSTSASDTDITLNGAITSNLSDYYFNETSGGACTGSAATATDCWSYWRVYQDSPSTYQNEVLSIDYFNVNYDHGAGGSMYLKFDDGQGTTAQDSSLYNNDGTISGAAWQSEDQCISGKCLWFDGSNDSVTVANTVSGVKTVSFWVKPNSFTSTTPLLDLDGTNKITTNSSGTLSASGFSTPTIYVNGVVGTAISANAWSYVTVTTATGVTASSIKVATDNTNYLKGFVDEVLLYSSTRSAAEVKTDYNSRGSDAGAVLGAQNQPGALSNGLVGYWKTDEGSGTSATDSSGNGNTGTITAGTGGYVSGKFGTAYDFDAANTAIDVGNGSSLNDISPITLAAWVYPDTGGEGGRGRIFDKATSVNPDNGWHLTNNNNLANSLQFAADCGATDLLKITNASTFPFSVWSHVVLTWDGSCTAANVHIYVNGVEVGYNSSQDGTSPRVTDATAHLRLGSDSTAGRTFDGKIDEARFYNRALSGNDISQLYNFAPGPTGYWKMDEKSGTTAYDVSGNGKNLTLSSASWSNGKVGGAWNGTGSVWASIADDSTLDFTNTQNFTLSAYFKSDSATNPGVAEYIMAKFPTDATHGGYALYMNTSGNVCIGTDTDGTFSPTDSVCSTTDVYDGTWHHAAGVKTGTTRMDLYVDGVANGTADTSISSVNTLENSQPFYIGDDDGDATNSFAGDIDEARVFNYDRSSKQIIESFNGGHPAPGSPVGSPLGYWKFEEGATNRCSGGTNDACNSGNGGTSYDGAFSGSAPSYTNSGKFGKALTFTAASANTVDLGDMTATEGVNQLTWSFWVKPGTLSTSDCILCKSVLSIAQQRSWMIFVDSADSSMLDVVVFDTSTDSVSTNIAKAPTGTLVNGTWAHVVVVYDATEIAANRIRFYINGNPRTATITGTIPSDGTVATTSNATMAGSADGAAGTFFDGTLDEVKVYTSALTAEQAKMEMNRGSGQVVGALSDKSGNEVNSAANEYCVPGDTATCTAAAGRWDFEDKSTTTAVDTSTNGNNGAITEALPATGKVGAALNLDGSNDVITVTNASPIDLNTNSGFTYEAWIYADAAGEGSGGQILNKSTATTGANSTYLRVDNLSGSNLDVEAHLDLATDATLNISTAVTTGTWNHVALVYTDDADDEVTIYVNGVNKGSSTDGVGSIAAESSNLLIGGPTTDNFDGKIDQFRFFGYERSAAQIAWDYNRGAPVGWWKLDECSGSTINDSSGNSNTGTVTLTPSGTTTVGNCSTSSTFWGGSDGTGAGKRNYAPTFDGTDDYIDAGTGTSLHITGDLTQAAWVKTTANSTKEIMSKGANTDWLYDMYHVGSGIVWCTIYQNTGSAYLETASTTAVNDGNWHHIACTLSGTTLTIYVDGQAQNTDTTTSGTRDTSSAGPFYIGRFDTTSDFYGAGKIDDVRVYNYGLTAAQVKTIMTDGAQRYGPSTGAP